MLKGTIEDLHEAWISANEIVEDRNKELKEKTNRKNLNSLFEKGDIDAIEEILVESKIDNIFYNRFLQLTFTKLIFYIEAAKLSGEELSKEVLDFYEENKKWLPNPIFTMEKGELVEAEKGVLKRERDAYLNSEDFTQTKKALEEQYQAIKKTNE